MTSSLGSKRLRNQRCSSPSRCALEASLHGHHRRRFERGAPPASRRSDSRPRTGSSSNSTTWTRRGTPAIDESSHTHSGGQRTTTSSWGFSTWIETRPDHSASTVWGASRYRMKRSGRALLPRSDRPVSHRASHPTEEEPRALRIPIPCAPRGATKPRAFGVSMRTSTATRSSMRRGDPPAHPIVRVDSMHTGPAETPNRPWSSSQSGHSVPHAAHSIAIGVTR